jgi:hypothetical protein
VTRFAVLSAALVGACAAGGASYTLDHGTVNYDNLKTATDKCHADGGEIVLRNGYDNRELSNYECRIGGAK